MKKFEYTTISVDPVDWADDDIDETFNSLGERGWELVTVASDNCINDAGETYTGCHWYTFKREIE